MPHPVDVLQATLDQGDRLIRRVRDALNQISTRIYLLDGYGTRGEHAGRVAISGVPSPTASTAEARLELGRRWDDYELQIQVLADTAVRLLAMADNDLGRERIADDVPRCHAGKGDPDAIFWVVGKMECDQPAEVNLRKDGSGWSLRYDGLCGRHYQQRRRYRDTRAARVNPKR